MRRLVAVDLPAGQSFFDVLVRAFEDGDAILPIDQRLPRPARTRLLEAMRPSAVVSRDGTERLSDGRPTEDGDALVVATSGTTGEPKGVVLSLEAVKASSVATCARLAVDPDSDRFLACLPLSHVGGLSVLTRSLFSGTPVEIHSGFDVADVTAAIGRGATIVSLVPTALDRLGAAASGFRRVVLGGAAPPEDVAQNVVSTYGLTETGSGVVYDGLPLDGVEVDVGPHGMISIRGPMLLRCYRDGSDPKDERGWLPTGDVGAIGADGRLKVLGRLDELIVSGGENVWPEAVEEVLAHHPGVAECAVAGLSDSEWGARVAAFVVQGDGPQVTLEALRELVRDTLGAVAAPKELIVVSELPRTTLGKVRRGELASLVGMAPR